MGKRWKNISDKDQKKLRKYWINFLIIGYLVILSGLLIAGVSFKNSQEGGSSQVIIYVGFFIIIFGFGIIMIPYFMKRALDREESKQVKFDKLKKR
jgi:hypothetical protein